VRGYSAWTLGWIVTDRLFLASELMVVSIMVGAVAVTQYTLTTYVTQFVLSIALVTASGFMPTLGSQLGSADLGAAAAGARSVRALVIGVVVLGSGAVLTFNGAFVDAWVGADHYLGTTLNILLVVCGLQFALIRMDGQILDVTLRIAPKVTIGLMAGVGGIVAGCVAYAHSHDLTVALLAVIAVRLIANLAYPVLVARSIPGSGVGARGLLLAFALLIVSAALGPTVRAGGPVTVAVVAVAWLTLAAAAVWCGLLPRDMLRSLLSRRPAPEREAHP
jgi:hypothetical protein